MKKFAALLAFSTILAFGATAQAADIVEAPACYDWRGPYVGAHAGYAWGSGDVDGVNDTDPQGFIGGALGGWNFQSDCLVFGFEGDVGFGEVDDSSGFVDDFDLEPNGHIRGRIGFAFDNVLPFIAGGLAVADMDVAIPGGQAVGIHGNDSNVHWGWTIGGGIDWAVAEHFVLRVEYLYDNYGSKSYDFNTNGLPSTEVSRDVDASSSTVRGAIIWNFGGL